MNSVKTAFYEDVFEPLHSNVIRPSSSLYTIEAPTTAVAGIRCNL